MRRLLCVAVLALCTRADGRYAQQPAPPPSSGGLTGGQIVALAIVTAAVAAVAWYALRHRCRGRDGSGCRDGGNASRRAGRGELRWRDGHRRKRRGRGSAMRMMGGSAGRAAALPIPPMAPPSRKARPGDAAAAVVRPASGSRGAATAMSGGRSTGMSMAGRGAAAEEGRGAGMMPSIRSAGAAVAD